MGLITVDLKLSAAVQFTLGNVDKGGFGDILFQFPPKITSDGRVGEWEEGNLRGDQPNFAFTLSGPRLIRLEWVYIVGEQAAGGTSGGAWTTLDVKKQVSGLRSYFSTVVHEGKAEQLAITYKHWLHGDPEFAITALMKTIDITHGKTIVVPNGVAADAYPLRTNCAVDLRLWTRGGIDGRQGETKVDLETLKGSLPTPWI